MRFHGLGCRPKCSGHGVRGEKCRLEGVGLRGRGRGGLVFKAHRLLYHSTLGLRVIKTKKVGVYGEEGCQECLAISHSGDG